MGKSKNAPVTEDQRVRVSAIITFAVIALAAVAAFSYWAGQRNAKKGSINITFGKDFSINMNVENDLQSMSSLLSKMFADERAKLEAQSLLADFYEVYSPRDEDPSGLLETFS
jgi:hypothetical protein